jgi:hypothetical protein
VIAARVVQAVRFTAELVAVAAVVSWALRVTPTPIRWPLAVVSAAAVIATWGRWIAPKSPRRLDDPARLAAELALFTLAAVALADAVTPGAGVAFGVVATTDALALRAMEEAL